MKRSAALILVCLSVVLSGCVHSRFVEFSREVSLPELAANMDERILNRR